MRSVFLFAMIFILCRCATKHQAIGFEPYFAKAPEDLLTSSVMGEIQLLEVKQQPSLLEKKRLFDLYLMEIKRLDPTNERSRKITSQSEVFKTEVEPLLRRMGELKTELAKETSVEADTKNFENGRLKKVYLQASQAWNRDENEKALDIVERMIRSEEFRKMASISDWIKILNLRFRVAMDLGQSATVKTAYGVLKEFAPCSSEAAQAGLIVALLHFTENENEQARRVFTEQCDQDDSLSNRLKRAYWNFRFQRGDSLQEEKARQALVSLPMPGYYAYLSHNLKGEKMTVFPKTENTAKYLEEAMVVSKEIHEWFLKAEAALQSRLRKDAGTYVSKAFQLLREKPGEHFFPLLYCAHLFRGSGLHLESMKVFTFLLGNNRQLSSEQVTQLEGELPELFPRPHLGVVESLAKNWGVDPDFVYSIMRQESAFNPGAISLADARGLMQMMPTLAKALSLQWGSQRTFQDRVLFSAGENLKLSVFHLHQLEKWGPHYALVAAAYNAGMSRVARWWKRFGHLPLDVFVELIPINETRNYVKLVLRNYLYYKALRLGGEVEPALFSMSLPPWGNVVAISKE